MLDNVKKNQNQQNSQCCQTTLDNIRPDILSGFFVEQLHRGEYLPRATIITDCRGIKKSSLTEKIRWRCCDDSDDGTSLPCGHNYVFPGTGGFHDDDALPAHRHCRPLRPDAYCAYNDGVNI